MDLFLSFLTCAVLFIKLLFALGFSFAFKSLRKNYFSADPEFSFLKDLKLVCQIQLNAIPKYALNLTKELLFPPSFPQFKEANLKNVDLGVNFINVKL